jgi:hypothetical protein
MTDFYAQLERQLVDAGRRRAVQGGLRRAATGRARLVAAACAVGLVLAAGGALVPGLLSGPASDTGGGAAPQPTPAPLLDPTDAHTLRGVRVAVLNGTMRSGLARSIADLLERLGATIQEIDSSADQTATETIVSFVGGAELQARRVAVALRAERVEPFAGTPAGSARGASVIVVAGSDLALP